MRQAIIEHAPGKPALVFVASRRQTRLTALDLISYAAADDAAAYDEGHSDVGGRRWVHMDQEALNALAEGLNDEALRNCIVFGVRPPSRSCDLVVWGVSNS